MEDRYLFRAKRLDNGERAKKLNHARFVVAMIVE